MDWKSDAVVQRRSQIAWRTFGADGVVLNLESEMMSGLNESAALVWEWLGSPRTVGHLMNLFASEFDLSPQEAEADLHHFLSELAERGLVAWS